MATFASNIHILGKTFDDGNGSTIQTFGMDLARSEFLTLVANSDPVDATMTGGSTFDISLLDHPNHELIGFVDSVRIDGPFTASDVFLRSRISNPGGTLKINSVVTIAFPTLSSSQFAFGLAAGVAGWVLLTPDEIDENGTWTERFTVHHPGAGDPDIQVDDTKNFSVTNHVEPSTFFKGTSAGKAMWWVDETTDQIHFLDSSNIEHTIRNTGGSLTATGSSPGQIYVDSTLPRLGFISNAKRFLTVTADEDRIDPKSLKTAGFIWVAAKSARPGHIQFIADDGKKYNLSDGPVA